jgi:hypothetical protein
MENKTKILINLFKQEEHIEKILEFIYKNVYQLIEEIPNIDNITYFELEKIYIIYYTKNIEDNHFYKSLFIPFQRLNLSKLYKGIVCKLNFFSMVEQQIPLYIYNEQDNWLIFYFIYKIIENNNIKYKKKIANCIVIKNLTEVNIRENIEEKNAIYSMKLVLYKSNTNENNKIRIPNVKIYLYNENLYNIQFINYKKNYYNQTLDQLRLKEKEKEKKILTIQEYSYLGYDNQLYNEYYAFLRNFKKKKEEKLN